MHLADGKVVLVVKKAMTDAQTKLSPKGLAEILAVAPSDRLTTTWAWIKSTP